MVEAWGYWYIIESRNYWVEKISDENIAARIFRCLKQIDGMGGLNDFEIMDCEETYEEFGKGWLESPQRQVTDILDHEFEWKIVRKAKQQVSLMDYMKDKKSREAI